MAVSIPLANNSMAEKLPAKTMTMTMNDNGKHFFSKSNAQCYKYIICK